MLASSPAGLLTSPDIHGRGNEPVRQAAILELQRTQGNRATRQLLQRQPTGTATPAVSREQAYRSATPTPLRTIADLITLVEHVEAAYPSEDWRGITTRIRKSYYDGFLWDSLIKDREGYPGLSWPPLSVQDFKAFATASAHPEITANGQSIDVGHVFTGVDAMNFPRTGAIMSLAGVEGPPGATWSGDVGSALAMWDLSSPRDRNRRAEFYDRYASSDDMLGDVDGIALSGPPSAAAAAGSTTLSARLRTYYQGTGGGAPGARQRFTKFAQASGLGWTGRGAGIQLTSFARQRIRQQVDNFGVNYRRQHGGSTGANWFHDEDLDWFVDRFVTWVQQGLTAENP